MIEDILRSFSVVDTACLVFAALVALIWRLGLPDEKISIYRDNRLFTVIQNKWETGFSGSRRMFKPSWFINIEAVYYKKIQRPNGLMYSVQESFVPIGKFANPKITQKEKKENESVGLVMESAYRNGELILDEEVQSIDEFTETAMMDSGIPGVLPRSEESHDETVRKDHYMASAQRMVRRRATRDHKLLSMQKEEPIKKYVVHFRIPFFTRWQFNSLIKDFLHVRLNEADKEELLQQLYWDYEERKLAC
jgi:hypothetical protein